MKQLQRMLCLASALSVVAPVYASSAQTRTASREAPYIVATVEVPMSMPTLRISRTLMALP